MQIKSRKLMLAAAFLAGTSLSAMAQSSGIGTGNPTVGTPGVSSTGTGTSTGPSTGIGSQVG
ncbi:MAG TPA: hypothetical protein VHW90_13780, partial [Stellaceae bacterium]|nr:hypothetical protein [Stellaceae bacterium]